MSRNTLSEHDRAYENALEQARIRFSGWSRHELLKARESERKMAEGPTLYGNTHQYIANCIVIHELLEKLK